MTRKRNLKNFFQNLSVKNVHLENSTIGMPVTSQLQFQPQPRIKVAKENIESENVQIPQPVINSPAFVQPQVFMPPIQYKNSQIQIQPAGPQIKSQVQPKTETPVPKVKESSWFRRRFGEIFGSTVLISGGVTTSVLFATNTISLASILAFFSSAVAVMAAVPLLTWLPAAISVGLVGIYAIAQAIRRVAARNSAKNSLEENSYNISGNKRYEILQKLNKVNRTDYYNLVANFLRAGQYERSQRFYGEKLAILNKYLGEDIVNKFINEPVVNIQPNLDY